VSVREIAYRVTARDHPLAILYRAAFLRQDARIRVVKPHCPEELHRPVDPIIDAGETASQERTMAQQPELPTDWLEFMQKMWNPMSFPMPGMAMPTVNVGDVEQKIAELKAVENWLTMQVGFLQMTVKTLEMQKAALESLAAAAPKAKPDPTK
jgi:hypothetical protein